MYVCSPAEAVLLLTLMCLTAYIHGAGGSAMVLTVQTITGKKYDLPTGDTPHDPSDGFVGLDCAFPGCTQRGFKLMEWTVPQLEHPHEFSDATTAHGLDPDFPMRDNYGNIAFCSLKCAYHFFEQLNSATHVGSPFPDAQLSFHRPAVYATRYRGFTIARLLGCDSTLSLSERLSTVQSPINSNHHNDHKVLLDTLPTLEEVLPRHRGELRTVREELHTEWVDGNMLDPSTPALTIVIEPLEEAAAAARTFNHTAVVPLPNTTEDER
jgi:hypothetical protein